MSNTVTVASLDTDTRRLAEHFGVTKTTIRAWVRAGILPPPAFRTRHVCRWNMATVLAYCEARRGEVAKEESAGAEHVA